MGKTLKVTVMYEFSVCLCPCPTLLHYLNIYNRVCVRARAFKYFSTTLTLNSGFTALSSRTAPHCRPRDFTLSANLPRDSHLSLLSHWLFADQSQNRNAK